MLRAHRRPQSQEVVVFVGQGPTAADRDEPRVSDLREDHPAALLLRGARRPGPGWGGSWVTVTGPCQYEEMTPSAEATVTWTQALAWRMDRHLLDPVRSLSAAEVVSRLGAVLSLDQWLADVAVST